MTGFALAALVHALAWVGRLLVMPEQGRDERREIADTVALSLVTTAYARHSSDERFSAQMDAIYHRWHFGEWPNG